MTNTSMNTNFTEKTMKYVYINPLHTLCCIVLVKSPIKNCFLGIHFAKYSHNLISFFNSYSYWYSSSNLTSLLTIAPQSTIYDKNCFLFTSS